MQHFPSFLAAPETKSPFDDEYLTKQYVNEYAVRLHKADMHRDTRKLYYATRYIGKLDMAVLPSYIQPLCVC